MTETVRYTLTDNVATIQLDDGKANALSTDMIAQINAAFDQAEKDDAIVVITGRDGLFSGGFNLKEMQAGQQESLALTSKGSKLARRILAFPKPVVALASGHSIAMGAFLLLACDYRMIADGDFKVGLNETLIGMTMHNFGIELARYRLPNHYFNRCVMNAEIFDPKGAMQAGFIDRIVPQEQMPMAAEMVGKLFGQLDMTAFRNTKLRSRKEVFAILDQAIEDDLDPAKVHAV